MMVLYNTCMSMIKNCVGRVIGPTTMSRVSPPKAHKGCHLTLLANKGLMPTLPFTSSYAFMFANKTSQQSSQGWEECVRLHNL